jgi:2-polyprenyl-3-methyl-5-hydroxy-6-metoxy-1,4-benzoquinol methylase
MKTGLPIQKCRVCGYKFFKEPLLRFQSMPRSAQFLPNAESLKKDKGVDLEISQCSGCGLVQLNNGPVPYYREVIRAAAVSEEMKGFRMKQFESFVQKFSLKGRKVIEIGCGRGEYLSLLQQCDVKAYGLEYSEESVRQCVKNGLKVSKGFIESPDYKLNSAPFDGFFMLNFLEHLPDPNSILKGIYNNLTDEAVGLVEAPNFDMILQNKLFSEFASDHLFYFTKETLGTTLRLNGFEIIECQEVWHEYIISATVKKKGRLDLSSFSEHQAKIKNEIEEYIRRFEAQKVAIWGAGHQALAIISLLNLAPKIKYVVDSAPFKQGKYTPTTHVPIVSPQMLELGPVDAVIVMAGSYSGEVARILRQKFGKNINIAILKDYGLQKI